MLACVGRIHNLKDLKGASGETKSGVEQVGPPQNLQPSRLDQIDRFQVSDLP